MPRKEAPAEGSYQHLDRMVIALLQGRVSEDIGVQTILDTHGREQIRAVLFNEGERYRRFNHEKFRDLVEQLRLRGILW